MRKLIILLVVAFFVLVAASYYLYLRSPTSYSGTVPELVALAPRDADWIAFLDFQAWRSSPMIAQLQELAPAAGEDAAYRKFVEETGFDYWRDLDRVMLTSVAERSTDLSWSRALAVADGRFARDKITDYALKNGSREEHKGQEILVIQETATFGQPQQKAGQTLLAFLARNRIALVDAGAKDGEQATQARSLILDAAQPLINDASLSPLAERARRVPGAPLIFVIRGDALQPLHQMLKQANPVAAQAADVLSKIQWLTLAARPEADAVSVSLLGECGSAWQSTQLSLLLDGLLVLARGAIQNPQTRKGLSKQELQQLEAVLTTIRVERRAEVVELRLALSKEAIALAISGSK